MAWVKFSVMIVSHCWTGKRLERVILQTKTFGEVLRGQPCPRSKPTQARLPSFWIGHPLHSSWPEEGQDYASLYRSKCTSALLMLSNFPNKFLNFSLDSPCSSLMSEYICCNISWGVAWEVQIEEQHLSVVSKPSSEAPDALEFDSGSSEGESWNGIKLKRCFYY